jgi:hypothetical protein
LKPLTGVDDGSPFLHKDLHALESLRGDDAQDRDPAAAANYITEASLDIYFIGDISQTEFSESEANQVKDTRALKPSKTLAAKSAKSSKGDKEDQPPVEEEIMEFEIFNNGNNRDEIIERTTGAIEQASAIINNFRGGINTAEDALDLVGNTLNLVGIFVPQVAIIASAFGMFRTIMGDNTVEDLNAKYHNEVLQELAALSEKIDGIAGVVQEANCRQTHDNIMSTRLTAFQSTYRNWLRVRGEQKDVEWDNLNKICRDVNIRPIAAMQALRDHLLRGMQGCSDVYRNSADGRVLWYNREVILRFMRYVHEIIEFEGVCQGTRNVADFRSVGLLEDYIKDMQALFNTTTDALENRWVTSFVNRFNDRNATLTSLSTLNELTFNWNPKYKYKVFEVERSDGGGWEHGLMANFGSHPNSDFNSILLKARGRNSWVIVMYIKPNKNAGGRLTWRNDACPGQYPDRSHPAGQMCVRIERWCCGFFGSCKKYCTGCRFGHERSAWHMAQEYSKSNTPALHDELVKRGAYLFTRSGKASRWHPTYYYVNIRNVRGHATWEMISFIQTDRSETNRFYSYELYYLHGGA